MREPRGPRAAPRRGRATTWLLAAAAALVLPVLLAPPAAAHGQLVVEESVPVEGARVGEPLENLSLVFTETPSPVAFFAVTAPDGSRVDDGWSSGQPAALDEPVQELNLVDGVWEPVFYPTGFPVEVRVAQWPAAGTYTVEYASVASDGEAVEGTYTFSYDGPVTQAPDGWVAPTEGRDPQLVALLDSAESPDAAGGEDPLPAGADQGEVAAPEPSAAASTTATASAPGGGGVGPAVYAVLGLGLTVVVGSVVLVARRGREPVVDGAGRRAGARSGNPAVRATSRR